MKSKLTTIFLMSTLALGALAQNAMARTPGRTALGHAAVSKKTPVKQVAAAPNRAISPNAIKK
jgi:hypothetical protein